MDIADESGLSPAKCITRRAYRYAIEDMPSAGELRRSLNRLNLKISHFIFFRLAKRGAGA